jgi:MATE family multidrug resistance protein
MHEPAADAPGRTLMRGATTSLAALQPHVRPLLRLAGPVILAELGWMSMGVVDTIMVGPLGPAAIGSVGLGGVLFMSIAIFGMGILLGLDTLVSQAHGGARPRECRHWLVTGLAVGMLFAVPVTLALRIGARHLDALRLHPSIVASTAAYVGTVAWGLVPLLGYAACRRYLQGMGVVQPITFALVSANVVNMVGNWMLIYGKLGMPALGVRGAAWATNFSRVYMVSVLLVAIVLHDQRTGGHVGAALRGLSFASMSRLIRLGLPAALQVTLEIGVFGAATALAGRLEPAALAAHQIALNVASFVYMVPLGMASAGAVMVGQHVGRGDHTGAAHAGWTALATIAAFMLAVAVLFVIAPRVLLIGFTRDELVLALGSTLLAVAAVFQLFDGLQVVATGVLRGVGDTRTPMLINLAGHWFCGLPIGWVLCFVIGLGVVGLWVGLSVGLILVGGVLVFVWRRRVDALTRTAVAPALGWTSDLLLPR